MATGDYLIEQRPPLTSEKRRTYLSFKKVMLDVSDDVTKRPRLVCFRKSFAHEIHRCICWDLG